MKSASLVFLLSLSVFFTTAQRTREVQKQNHVWLSLNTNSKISNHWSVITDFHMRRTNFLKDNNFFFLRFGAAYIINEKLSTAIGAGRLWLANRNGATELFSNENRIYQQLQLTNSWGKKTLTHTLRTEERWQEKVVNALPTNDYRYSTRFRYQLSVVVPVSKNKWVPSLAFADEILLQKGKEIIYNTFDQNRIFAGIKQPLSPSLSFDFGYMLVYQQKLSGYQYTRNHTIRLFFYWKPDFRKKNSSHINTVHLTEE